MKTHKLNQFTKGWIVGDFSPSILKTKSFEFMVRSYNPGDSEVAHVHKIADEITVIVNGIFIMNGSKLSAGDIIHLSPGDPANFECIEAGTTAVIKTPSVIGDKYIL